VRIWDTSSNSHICKVIFDIKGPPLLLLFNSIPNDVSAYKQNLNDRLPDGVISY
jgi:hypothetical protein